MVTFENVRHGAVPHFYLPEELKNDMVPYLRKAHIAILMYNKEHGEPYVKFPAVPDGLLPYQVPDGLRAYAAEDNIEG